MKFLFVLLVAGLVAGTAHATTTYSPERFRDSAGQSALTPLLASYYELKNALVNSDATAAALKAADLLKAIGGVDRKALSADEQQSLKAFQDKLSFDARHISEVKNISHQREHFATLSVNMFSLLKGAKLSGQTVYEDYCPMKKAYWLSSEAIIKNPYFGNEMLTCGQVKETLH